MNSLDKIPRPIIHASFWVVLYGFNLLFWGSSLENLSYVLIINLFFTFFRIIVAYLNLYLFIPRYFSKNKSLYFLCLFLAILILSIFLRYAVAEYFFYALDPGTSVDEETVSSFFAYSKQFLIEFYIQSIIIAIKLGRNWITSSKKALELEQKHIESELNFLKSQIQPHFFFNTLNNLYALCTSDPSKAADSILKLSKVMDYVLYRSSKSLVPLRQEIAIINEYIELEKLRIDHRFRLELNVDSTIEGVEIPPMVLLPLIENSFKHGIHETRGQVSLMIDIGTSDGYLTTYIVNPIPPSTIHSTDSGIGLSNLEKRLKLLYLNNFELKPERMAATFSVQLKIPINEY